MVELEHLSNPTPTLEPGNNCPEPQCPFNTLFENSNLEKYEIRSKICTPCIARAKTDKELDRLRKEFSKEHKNGAS